MASRIVGGALLVALAAAGSRPAAAETSDRDHERLRAAMVREQIAARGVADPRVLDAMRKVPRHRYVPPAWRHEAYADHPLPIGEGQTISQPYIVGLMSELLALSGEERVLEIGTGSGYQAAILAELAREVYTIEIVEPLARRAEETLRTEGYAGVRVRAGDGYLGWPEAAPFDAIIVTAAPDHVPRPLVEQLRPGGRLVIPVGDRFQELLLITKTGDGVETRGVIPVRFVPMTGEGVKRGGR